MITLKIGTFPGELKEYALEDGSSIAEALAAAGITVDEEQQIKLDGEIVTADDTIDSFSSLLLVTKRLKGAM